MGRIDGRCPGIIGRAAYQSFVQYEAYADAEIHRPLGMRPRLVADVRGYECSRQAEPGQVMNRRRWRCARRWCRQRGLNSRPSVYKTAALPLSYAGCRIKALAPKRRPFRGIAGWPILCCAVHYQSCPRRATGRRNLLDFPQRTCVRRAGLQPPAKEQHIDRAGGQEGHGKRRLNPVTPDMVDHSHCLMTIRRF